MTNQASLLPVSSNLHMHGCFVGQNNVKSRQPSTNATNFINSFILEYLFQRNFINVFTKQYRECANKMT